jgi:ketosteroid isomerase-like protein
MNKTSIILICILVFVSCKHTVNTDVAKNEILQTEKAFEKMASEKGLAEAFYYFADQNAAIRRGNDSLIVGKDNIKLYYNKNANPDAKLSWTPDFIGVSDCSTFGYTYGKYLYTIRDSTGKTSEYKGIFHTVWKKQNNNWKYVWD